MLTIVIFDSIIPLWLFDNPIVSLVNLSPASVRVCVTVQGVWGRQMRIMVSDVKVLMVTGMA